MGWYRPYGSDRLVWRDAPDPTAGREPTPDDVLDALVPGRAAMRERVGADDRRERQAIGNFVGDLLLQGHTIDRAKQIATTAARRNDTGEPLPYRDNHTNAPARSGNGG